MKAFAFVLLIGALTLGTARAQFFNGGPCQPGRCWHNNSKECVDARNAFAEHHNGRYPEQYCNQYYQGQRGRWIQNGNQWQWSGGGSNQWYQGRQGHWFQEPNGWQFHGDKGEEYSKDHEGAWRWNNPVQPKVARDTHPTHRIDKK